MHRALKLFAVVSASVRAGKPYVDFYAVLGGGPTVPQPYFRYPRLLGRTTADIDGPAEAISFFMSSAVPQRPEIIPTDARPFGL